ncbi:MAG: hypothetical protein AAGF23_20725 [Acidobacteriota bacterium]
MTRKTLPLVLLSGLLVLASSTAADARDRASDAGDSGAEAETPATLVPFELEDQFGEATTSGDLEGRPALVIAADGGGSDFTGPWSAELGEAIAELGLGDRVRILGLADLRSVPSFMRKRVRGTFSTDPSDATLLDWSGVFAEAYGFEKRHCNLILFDADGAVAQQAAVQGLDDGVLDGFVTALGNLRRP